MIVQARTQCGTVVASQPIAIGSCTLFFHSNFNYQLEKLANKDQNRIFDFQSFFIRISFWVHPGIIHIQYDYFISIYFVIEPVVADN